MTDTLHEHFPEDEEVLSMSYVRLSDAELWDDNPKEHDLQGVIDSITKNGFRDPPEYDGAIHAIVAGNGRTTALRMMQQSGESVPRFIGVDDDGEWLIPMIFGADSESQDAAKRYAVDHNLLTLGIPRITAEQVEEMFRAEDMRALFKPGDELPLTITESVMEALYTEEQSNDLELENFDDSLAEAFAHTEQFSTKVQLIVDLTQEQADSADLKEALKELSRDYELNYRIKTAR